MVYPHVFRTEHSETKTTNGEYGSIYSSSQFTKISIQPELLKILQFVDSKREKFLKDLKEMIKFKSVSECVEHLEDTGQMIKFIETWLVRLGIKYERFDVGSMDLNGKTHKIPTVIYARIGKDPKKKTVLVYAYIDVKKPDADKWNSDPWDTTIVEHKVYGNGVAGGKGPLLCWFHVIQGFLEAGIPLPVNIKFVIEAMHYSRSLGMKKFLLTYRQHFFYDVNFIVANDDEWLGIKYPCIYYGCVGMLHFMLTVTKKESSNAEAKEDLIKICNEIVNDEGDILIPNFNNYVQQITPDEEKRYEAIQEFDPDDIRPNLPPHQQKLDKVPLLMHFWRLPSVYMDDIQECICDKKDFSTVKRHIIFKIVPRQIDYKAIEDVKNFVKDVKKRLKLESKVECELITSSRPWVEDPLSPNYTAASNAIIQIYKMKPSWIREDRPNLIVTMLSRLLERNVLLLPLVTKGANISESNENISTKCFYEGTKLLAAYILQLAVVK